MMRVLVEVNQRMIEVDLNSLFSVPFPAEKMEEYHRKYLIDALKLNLGINLDSKSYSVKFREPYLFVMPLN